MVEYVCNHCEMVVKNNGGSAREVGLICVGHRFRKMKPKFYCYECGKKITRSLLEEI